MTPEFLLPLALFALVHLTATMSPGPAFIMTVRNAIAHDRNAGIFTALGLGLGNLPLLFLVFTGGAFLIHTYPPLFTAIKIIGACYLIFIGLKGLRAAPASHQDVNQDAKARNPGRSRLSFLGQGILTNLTNPKGWVFYAALGTQFVKPDMPLAIIALYFLVDFTIESAWFSALSVFLTTKTIRARFLAISHWIERICGGLLITLGIKLIFDKGLKAIS